MQLGACVHCLECSREVFGSIRISTGADIYIYCFGASCYRFCAYLLEPAPPRWPSCMSCIHVRMPRSSAMPSQLTEVLLLAEAPPLIDTDQLIICMIGRL